MIITIVMKDVVLMLQILGFVVLDVKGHFGYHHHSSISA